MFMCFKNCFVITVFKPLETLSQKDEIKDQPTAEQGEA